MKRSHSAFAGFFLMSLSVVWATDRIAADSLQVEGQSVQLGSGITIQEGVLTKHPGWCVQGKQTQQKFFTSPRYELSFGPDAEFPGGAVLTVSVAVVKSRLTLEQPRLMLSRASDEFKLICGAQFVSALEMGGKAVIKIRYSGLSERTSDHFMKFQTVDSAKALDRFETSLEDLLSDISAQVNGIESFSSPMSVGFGKNARVEAGWIMKALKRYAEWAQDHELEYTVIHYQFSDYSKAEDSNALSRKHIRDMRFR